jgi:peroxiredoxin Q/BCP
VRDEQPRYAEHQVTTLGVNPASVASHEKYAEGFQFTFPLLSDPDRNVARAYRALKPDGKGILRTVYLIGTDGKVLFSQRGAPGAFDVLAPFKDRAS